MSKTNCVDWVVRAGVCGAIAFFGVPAMVSAIGFKAAGIAAGSTAALMMSSMATGGVTASGGVVATCQSIGAAGAISKLSASVIGLGMTLFSSPR